MEIIKKSKWERIIEILLNLFAISVMVLIISAVTFTSVIAWVYFINWIKA